MYNLSFLLLFLYYILVLPIIQAFSGQICPKYALKKQVKSMIYEIVGDLNEFVVKIQHYKA